MKVELRSVRNTLVALFVPLSAVADQHVSTGELAKHLTESRIGLPYFSARSRRYIKSRHSILALLFLCPILLIGFQSEGRCHELNNAGFEQLIDDEDSLDGWDLRTYGYEAITDTEVSWSGKASLRFISGHNPRSASVRQEIPAALVREGTSRITGYVRTAALDKEAALFVLVDEANGRRFLDWMRGRAASGDTEWTRLELRIPMLPDASTVYVGVLIAGVGTAWFDELKIERLELSDIKSYNARQYLEEAIGLLQKYSINRDITDWASLRHQVEILASGAETISDVYPAIESAIYLLKDNHSTLIKPSRAAALNTGEADSTELARWKSPVGRIEGDSFGYVSVPPMMGTNSSRQTKYADELQARIAELDSPDICGWIVNLRENHGGNVFPMLAGIGPILGEGNAGGGVTADGNMLPRSYINGISGPAKVSDVPYSLIQPNPPVAVLFGGRTGSSGEAVVLAFIGRPNTKTFGQLSGGLTTGNAGYELSDGAILNIAVTRMVDRTGKVYGGKITPDVQIAAPTKDDTGLDETVQSAVSWLNAQCDRTGTQNASPFIPIPSSAFNRRTLRAIG